MFHRFTWLCFKRRRQICEVNWAVCNDPMAQLWNKARWRQKDPLLPVFHSRTPNKAFRYQHDKKTVCNVQHDSCNCKIWPLQKRINPGNEGLVSQKNCSSRTNRTVWLGAVLSFEARHRQNKRSSLFEFWQNSTLCDRNFNRSVKSIMCKFCQKISLGKVRSIKLRTYRF